MADLTTLILGEVAKLGLSAAIERFYDRIKQDASEELTEALRNADISFDEAIEQDETIAMLHRYDRAWKEGAAREKLRIIAKILAGEIGRGPQGADEFQQFADIVLGLSHEERVFLATLYEKETWAALQDSSAEGAHKLASYELYQALVGPGKLLEHEDAFGAVGIALGRTGLVLPVVLAGGGFSFAMTLRLQRLIDLVGAEELANRVLKND